MIVIMSNSTDKTTSLVMDWIDFLGGRSFRINRGDELELMEYNFSSAEINIKLKVNGKPIELFNIKSYWYRRGDILTKEFIRDQLIGLNRNVASQVSHHLEAEMNVLRESLHYLLESKTSIGGRKQCDINKLVVLQKAKKLGIEIPKTSVVSKKKEYPVEKDESFITKSLSESPIIDVKNNEGKQEKYSTYTALLTNDLKTGNIFPSLIQENLSKKYELRIFYLKGGFYAMAIFSQSDEQTSVDFRRYNLKKPNRTQEYKLPEEIEQKLELLMNDLKLDTGSIDMILTTDNRYVLLEINPVGQFGMVSRPCNYQLEKRIAEYLMNQ